MYEDQREFMNHEEANYHIIADALGPIADEIYRDPPGEPTFTQKYGSNPTTGGTNMNNDNGNNNDYRYANEVSRQNNGQPQNGFSGYGNPTPQYGQQQYSQQYSQPQYGQQGTTAGYAQQPGGAGREWVVNRADGLHDRLPKVFGKAIVAVRKNGRGNILAFKLEDGNVLDYAQMLDANTQGGFQGLRVQENKEGELIIRSVPDGYTDNNLDNLPQF